MADLTMTPQEIQNDFGVDISAVALSDYPIYEESHRKELNEKILRRYWTRDIAFETIDLFTFNLRRLMFENMPYFNNLYETEKINFDPLSTYELNESSKTNSTMNDKTNASQSATTNSASDQKSRASSFTGPSTQVAETGNYADGKTLTTSETGANSTSSGDTEQSSEQTMNADTEHHTSGRIGDSAELLRSYREAIINIDLMVITSVSPAFMKIWNMSIGPFDRRTNYGILAAPTLWF